MSAPRISLIVASAGTGKTTRIVDAIATAVSERPPSSLLATTFTIKAADEIVERARARLFADGKAELASGLLAARFGTVNAVSGRIGTQFALDLGRSPALSVIPEGSLPRIFAGAAAEAITRHAPILNRIADRFGASEPRRPQEGERVDWRRTVRLIVEAARANGLRPSVLAESATRSRDSFLALLRLPTQSPEALDATLQVAIEHALAHVPEPCSVAAQRSVVIMRKVSAAIRRGADVPWTDWARLTKAKCAQKDGAAFSAAIDALKAAAGAHAEHPRLRHDCVTFIDTLFECAAESFEAYQRYKSTRGLVDFTDQETLALEVVTTPALAARLGEQVSVTFVDEFQDSSPVQVALFTALAGIVEASCWVGDPKQAIYGFRNADAALTQAAFDGVREAGATPPEVLATSYRSRQGIIDLVNAAFGPAFEMMGLPAAEHAFAETARNDHGFQVPPLSVWWLEGHAAGQHSALATAVADALAAAEQWLVGLKEGSMRSLRGSDIAILCYSNPEVAAVAAALHARGVPASVERDGLLQTPHVELVMAAIRWVADPSDSLALAEMARFFADDPASEAWLAAAAAEERLGAFRPLIPILEALEQLRSELLALTPAELVDSVIALPGVVERIESWSRPAERMADLEALRGYAHDYEDECAGDAGCATPSGLILALRVNGGKRPRSLAEDAVQVLTYHRAKGLEWPMVILTSLGREPAARLFEPVAVPGGAIDWRAPLADRWIRFWPWPYGGQSKDVILDELAAQSDVGRAAAQAAQAEAVRLLYVGFTRARDYLILAPAIKAGTKWLDCLRVGDGAEPITLPKQDGDPIRAYAAVCPALTAIPTARDGDDPRARPPSFISTARQVRARSPLRRRPSEAAVTDRYRVAERIEIGGRIAFNGSVDMRLLGEAMHAVLACYDETRPRQESTGLAERIFDRWRVVGVTPSDAVDSCERLHAWLLSRWPEADWRREVPVTARIDGQVISGAIDLLGTQMGQAIVIDHKSFPGSRDQWDAKAAGYGAQLAAYRDALAVAGVRCESLWVHMPVVGQVLRIEPGD